MSDAINSGTLNQHITSSDVSGDCTSERCDWNPYWTLAICPITEDVTSRITSVDPGTVDGIPMISQRIKSGEYLSLAITSDPTYINRVDGSDSNLTIEARGTTSDSLILWYDPCSPDYTKLNSDQRYWRAHRSTLKLCLQQLNSSYYNSTMHTELLESKIDIAWRAENISKTGTNDICTDSPDATHCVEEKYLSAWAWNLLGVLNGNASTAPGGDNHYEPAEMRRFLTDLVGIDPTLCSHDANLGYPALERRFQNMASAMSNR